jgi:hypothetical protein
MNAEEARKRINAFAQRQGRRARGGNLAHCVNGYVKALYIAYGPIAGLSPEQAVHDALAAVIVSPQESLFAGAP